MWVATLHQLSIAALRLTNMYYMLFPQEGGLTPTI